MATPEEFKDFLASLDPDEAAQMLREARPKEHWTSAVPATTSGSVAARPAVSHPRAVTAEPGAR